MEKESGAEGETTGQQQARSRCWTLLPRVSEARSSWLSDWREGGKRERWTRRRRRSIERERQRQRRIPRPKKQHRERDAVPISLLGMIHDTPYTISNNKHPRPDAPPQADILIPPALDLDEVQRRTRPTSTTQRQKRHQLSGEGKDALPPWSTLAEGRTRNHSGVAASRPKEATPDAQDRASAHAICHRRRVRFVALPRGSELPE